MDFYWSKLLPPTCFCLFLRRTRVHDDSRTVQVADFVFIASSCDLLVDLATARRDLPLLFSRYCGAGRDHFGNPVCRLSVVKNMVTGSVTGSIFFHLK